MLQGTLLPTRLFQLSRQGLWIKPSSSSTSGDKGILAAFSVRKLCRLREGDRQGQGLGGFSAASPVHERHGFSPAVDAIRVPGNL